jgi:hypothetical protein
MIKKLLHSPEVFASREAVLRFFFTPQQQLLTTKRTTIGVYTAAQKND